MAVSLDLTNPRPRDVLSARQPTEKPSIIGMSREQLASALEALGVPSRQIKMRVSQIWHWLYVRGVSDYAAMANISRELRAKLSDSLALTRPEIVEEQVSEDGTRKWLFRFPPRGGKRKPSTSRKTAAARCAFQVRSDAP